MLDLHSATMSHIVCLMFNPVLSKQNRKQELESHDKSGNEDSGDMSEEEEEEEVGHGRRSGLWSGLHNKLSHSLISFIFTVIYILHLAV